MKPALNETPLPKYIAIEGPIGVGKTTLANKIAETFNYDAFLEQPAENPFLKNFYRNPSQSALATQLFFLFQRMQQIQDLKQRSLFENVRVADFLIEKDRLFAEVTLSNEEMNLYDKVYEHITLDAPTPDLVIYLQAPIEILKERFPNMKVPKKDDICYATQNRQDAVKQLALESDYMIVVGSKNSSNSNRLKELAEKCGCKSVLIDGFEDLNLSELDGCNKISITRLPNPSKIF